MNFLLSFNLSTCLFLELGKDEDNLLFSNYNLRNNDLFSEVTCCPPSPPTLEVFYSTGFDDSIEPVYNSNMLRSSYDFNNNDTDSSTEHCNGSPAFLPLYEIPKWATNPATKICKSRDLFRRKCQSSANPITESSSDSLSAESITYTSNFSDEPSIKCFPNIPSKSEDKNRNSLSDSFIPVSPEHCDNNMKHLLGTSDIHVPNNTIDFISSERHDQIASPGELDTDQPAVGTLSAVPMLSCCLRRLTDTKHEVPDHSSLTASVVRFFKRSKRFYHAATSTRNIRSVSELHTSAGAASHNEVSTDPGAPCPSSPSSSWLLNPSSSVLRAQSDPQYSSSIDSPSFGLINHIITVNKWQSDDCHQNDEILNSGSDEDNYNRVQTPKTSIRRKTALMRSHSIHELLAEPISQSLSNFSPSRRSESLDKSTIQQSGMTKTDQPLFSLGVLDSLSQSLERTWCAPFYERIKKELRSTKLKVCLYVVFILLRY